MTRKLIRNIYDRDGFPPYPEPKRRHRPAFDAMLDELLAMAPPAKRAR